MTEDAKVESEDSNDVKIVENEEEAKLEEYRSWSDKKISPVTKNESKKVVKNETVHVMSPENRRSILATHEAMKRKIQEDMFPDEVYAPVPMKKARGPPQPKNAVMQLNEYKAGLKYETLETSGPSHALVFKVGVTVNGVQYTGQGRSKKVAKSVAAEAALLDLVQFKNPVQMVPPAPQSSMDFTEDVDISVKPEKDDDQKQVITPDNQKRKKEKPDKVKTPNTGQNPMMTLNELRPGLVWECTELGHSPATKKFCFKTMIQGQVYEGTGVSKKLAKVAAAKSALNDLYNMNFVVDGEVDDALATGDMKVAGTDMVLSEFSENQSVADNIGRLILEKFDQLVANRTVIARRKVIAGIVMTLDPEMKKMVVVCVSTGTKCVSGEYMSVSGSALNDCHAEIVSRRCLMDFLYTQLEKIAARKGEIDEDSIIVKSERGGYKVKEDVKFHLYINTAPCGDARIFSPHEERGNYRSAYSQSDDHPQRRARGVLRTKIENGEGTIPVMNSDSSIQTWDGVMQGSRLLTMSCADKVCRWNVLGLQGSLLAYFLQPVYLHSVVLGSLFHPTHMYRALTGRVKDSLDNLPDTFKLNTPKFNLMTSKEIRQPGKAPNHSVNWTIGMKDVEAVDGMKGKLLESLEPSRLCKFSMFKRWRQLAENHNIQRVETLSESVPELYSEAKRGSVKFQEAKKSLFNAFKKGGLGDWIKKPMEQDEFEI